MVRVKMCDGTEAEFETVLSAPTPYSLSDSDPAVTLAATGVVSNSSGSFRVVAVANDETTVLHQVSPEHEESLIAAAVKEHTGVKLSFGRWISLAKKGAWPAEADAAELALFGPHCCVSDAFITLKQGQKRSRDAASRKRRAGTMPRTDAPAMQMSVTFTGTPAQVQAAVQNYAACAIQQEGH